MSQCPCLAQFLRYSMILVKNRPFEPTPPLFVAHLCMYVCYVCRDSLGCKAAARTQIYACAAAYSLDCHGCAMIYRRLWGDSVGISPKILATKNLSPCAIVSWRCLCDPTGG